MLKAEQAELLGKLKDQIEPLLTEWWHCKLRFVRPEKLHTTCLFLGDCDETEEADILSLMSDEIPKLKSCTLHYDRLSFFGSSARPNAMVLLPSHVPDEMKTIGRTVRTLLSGFCKNKENLEFRPHLTIFRFPKEHRRRYELKEPLNLTAYLPLVQEIKQISLIESHLGSQAADYEIIAEFKLRD